MSVETLIPVEEYLNTSYDPDVEYVDGVLVERNVGDLLHSLVQSNIGHHMRRKYPHVYALPELRSQTRSTRYRLPDITVLLSFPQTDYVLEAAFLAVEILSKSDSMTSVIEKLDEYTQKGVANIWLIDPRLEKMFTFRSHNLQEVEDIIATDNPRLELTRDEVFQK
ncbi:MAG: Uma2 family endonuclease [Acidobacteriia bacterium]|nr:Uma2 family endonuclease [Terriglobia bacterium]